ncbi:MAG: type I restriction-modification system subunit M N-terminal domain-containing protein [Rhodoferax sp.]
MNRDLKASEYSTPVLGLIFLKFADNKYRQHEDAILELGPMDVAQQNYFQAHGAAEAVDARNEAQHALWTTAAVGASGPRDAPPRA